MGSEMCIRDRSELNPIITQNFENFLKKLELNTDYKFNSKPEQLGELLFNDKKFSKGIVKYVLLRDIGDPVLVDFNLNDLLHEVTDE